MASASAAAALAAVGAPEPQSPCAACWLDAAAHGRLDDMKRISQQLTPAANATPSAAATAAAVDRATLLDCRDPHGRTALFLCCMRDDAEGARWLVQQGADLDARDEWQQSALLKSVMGGCTECVQLLLEHGADTDLTDTEGKSALLWACEFNEVACVRLLWQQRHLIRFDSQRSALGLTPLMSACQQGSIECARFLVEEAAVDIEAEDASGKTALVHSAASGNLPCVRLLVSRGAAVEHGDGDGDTPLIWAAWQGHADCAEYLLADGRADIDRQDAAGRTALMNAVRWGHAGCVRLLLDRRADATTVSHGGNTAWSLAVCADAPDTTVIQWLSDAAEQQAQARRGLEAAPPSESESESAPESAAPAGSASAFASPCGSAHAHASVPPSASVPALPPSSLCPAAAPLPSSSPSLSLSLAQRCFRDGLQSIFQFVPLRDAVSKLPRVSTAWCAAWDACAQRSRPPLHFHARSPQILRSLLLSPIACHLRALRTFDAEADTPAEMAGSEFGSGPSFSSFPSSRAAPRADWSLTPADVALLSARTPALTELTAQLLLPADPLADSDDEEEIGDAAGDLLPAALPLPPLEDEYGCDDETSFRFPLTLQSVHLRVVSDDDSLPNPNLARLIQHLARLPDLRKLTLALSPAEADDDGDGSELGLERLSVLRDSPALTSLSLHAASAQGHLDLSPALLVALSQLSQLRELNLNRGEQSLQTLALLPSVRFPLVESFDTRRITVTGPFPHLARQLPSLTEFCPTSWSNPQHLRWLVDALHPRLRRLHFHLRALVQPHAASAEDLAPLARLTQLRHLSMAQVDLAHSPAAAVQWAQALRSMQLRTLHLTRVRLPRDALTTLAECAPLLEELSFSRCSLAAGQADLADLRPLTRLRTLRCSSSLLAPTAPLVEALRHPSRLLPSLRVLHWQPCVDPQLEYDHADHAVPTVERWW